MSANPHIKILLATYNGSANLEEQLQSISAQTHANWSILASDDGSTDDTRDVLDRFNKLGHRVTVLDGPRSGAAENFMSLVRRLSDHTEDGDWAAFSDQDDVWLPSKLERAVNRLNAINDDQPALFCARTWITDEQLGGKRVSAPRPLPLSFRNALVQNVAAGNTIVVNKIGAKLLAEAAQEVEEVVIHDWWAYQIVSGAGGHLCHDDEPALLYRQHSVNQIGANDSKRAKLKRMAMLLSGTYTQWNKINVAAMRQSSHRFTAENQHILDEFARLHDLPVLQRMRSMKQLRLYRQTRASTAALWFAALARRI
ncbi:glycosyltransferase family 2 protein [Aliiroseovarius sp. F47248L]|uniref:glycosyltransferase family 2 protein n=1 Tax=Aliiroseovarius sp. F47248L TaxID=2926420 RepID=UPI001FF6C99B|nr:glycosyltransferase family 2 protein [Aliiroseovarius sp. F47248L]MCK0140346.1 glycosyltransferase family 2 protein [Aliiroseovarius sp. F47248L]